MKIQQLKINHYGKLQNKEIKFGNNINLIYGKNEAGKSTILSYIVNIFYGISKNKKGKEYSDFEKYEPWVGEEFSGKLTYQLDNKKTYEIQRDFKKKNPKIFNENMEDISKEFPIDKSTGNSFFYEQTKVDEQLFLSTLVANQQETRLQKSEQGILVQKIANLVGTGEDKVSYKIAVDRLNRRQLDEIGSSRTREKPINLIEKKIIQIEEEKEKLQQYQDKQYETETKEKQLLKQIQELEKEMQEIQQLKISYEEQEMENQKIAVKENIKEQNSEKIKEINERLNDIIKTCEEKKTKSEKAQKYGKYLFVITAIILILNAILQPIFLGNVIINIVTIAVSIIFLAIAILVITKKHKQDIKEQKENLKQYEILKEKQNLLENEIKILEKSNEEIEKEIQTLKKYPKIAKEQMETITSKNILYKMQSTQNNINDKKIELHALQLDKNNIIPSLEKLAKMEEEYANLQEQRQELQKLNTAIDIAKQVLEECYETMRHTVTPKFTQNLSNIICNITNQKYTHVRFHDEQGLIVENEKGEYIPATKLSIGTIEQLYLSLRLSMIDDLSSEQLPIILDETFAYFDEERLENFLTYMSKTYSNRQILIFTCTNREKNILDKQKIPYDLIEL